jgi:hypothetical protein
MIKENPIELFLPLIPETSGINGKNSAMVFFSDHK